MPAALSIFELPPEVLAMIFKHAFGDHEREMDSLSSVLTAVATNACGWSKHNDVVDEGAEFPHAVLTTATNHHISLCRSQALFPYSLIGAYRPWTNVLASCPAYWTEILLFIDAIPSTSEELSSYLNWSGDLSINICITRRKADAFKLKSDVDVKSWERLRVDQFVGLLQPHLKRCRTIHIDTTCSSSLPLIGADFTGSAPDLVVLSLQCDVDDALSDPVRERKALELLGSPDEFAPSLKMLALDGRNFLFAFKNETSWARGILELIVANYCPAAVAAATNRSEGEGLERGDRGDKRKEKKEGETIQEESGSDDEGNDEDRPEILETPEVSLMNFVDAFEGGNLGEVSYLRLQNVKLDTSYPFLCYRIYLELFTNIDFEGLEEKVISDFFKYAYIDDNEVLKLKNCRITAKVGQKRSEDIGIFNEAYNDPGCFIISSPIPGCQFAKNIQWCKSAKVVLEDCPQPQVNDMLAELSVEAIGEDVWYDHNPEVGSQAQMPPPKVNGGKYFWSPGLVELELIRCATVDMNVLKRFVEARNHYVNYSDPEWRETTNWRPGIRRIFLKECLPNGMSEEDRQWFSERVALFELS